MCYAACGDPTQALYWAKRVVEELPEEASDEAREECERNIKTIEQHLASQLTQKS